MRPAVKRHHRSSRALTRDAPTLRDLLIFEIARPGMFIWRRGCRRESPFRPDPPILRAPRAPPRPICRLTFLNSFRRARARARVRREASFFISYVSHGLGLPFPFYRRRGDDGFRRRPKCQLRKTRQRPRDERSTSELHPAAPCLAVMRASDIVRTACWEGKYRASTNKRIAGVNGSLMSLLGRDKRINIDVRAIFSPILLASIVTFHYSRWLIYGGTETQEIIARHVSAQEISQEF